jgi:lipopolysaccharide export LptBFGC system permease protein LptF
VATLLACLFGIGRLTQRHELTAMKAAGIGLRNILAIVLPVALCLSLLQFLFNGWMVPKATERKLAIERRYLQQLALQGPLFNLYFRDAPQRTVVLQRYDPEQRQAAIVLIEEYRTANAPHLLRRWEAQQMFWDSLRQVWRARQVIERTYEGDQVRVQSFPERDFALRLRHEHLLQLQRSPAEMPLPELRRFIATLRAGGQDVYALETNYFAEFALPFAHFVVALFAVPLASVYRRSGLAAQFSAAAVIVFVYMVFARVSQIVGATALLPAPLAGWSAKYRVPRCWSYHRMAHPDITSAERPQHSIRQRFPELQRRGRWRALWTAWWLCVRGDEAQGATGTGLVARHSTVAGGGGAPLLLLPGQRAGLLRCCGSACAAGHASLLA